MDSQEFYNYTSPIGILLLQSDPTNKSISKVLYATQIVGYRVASDEDKPEIISQLESELDSYFEGMLRDFSVSFLMSGTDFQKRVYEAALEIGYGNLSTYSSIAKYIGNEKARRAVGSALSRNKINIIIPCHRIVSAKNNSLVGYAGGLVAKKFLIEHEIEHSNQQQSELVDELKY